MVFGQLGRLFGQLREAGIKNHDFSICSANISYVKLRTIEDQIEDEIEVNRGQLRTSSIVLNSTSIDLY